MQRLALGMILLAATAHADGEVPLQVEVGKTIEVNVNYARGILCDDVSIVKVDLVTRDDRNWFVVTGAKPGRTSCRVGTSPVTPPWYVFAITVTASRKR